MRNHSQIIADEGGYRPLAEKLTEAGHPVEAEQARFWARREVIPPEHWPAIAGLGIATLEELAGSFAERRLGKSDNDAAPERGAAA